MDQKKQEKIENPNGQFAERVLELAQDILGAPMYKRVHEPLFNNSVVSLLRTPQYRIYFEDKVAEYYLPTTITPEGRLQFQRIVIKVFDELSKEDVKSEVNALKEQLHKVPNIDSETMILVAQKANSRSLIRGFRHVLARGYLTVIVIAEDPKVVWMRILTLLRKFWFTRIMQLCEILSTTEILSELIDKELIENVNRNLLIESINFNSINCNSINGALETILSNMMLTLQYFNEIYRNLSRETQIIPGVSKAIAAEETKVKAEVEEEVQEACYFCKGLKVTNPNKAVALAISKQSGKKYPVCEKHMYELKDYPDKWYVDYDGFNIHTNQPAKTFR